MIVARTAADLRAALAGPRRSGRVGLVPTMGALHDGHLSLVHAARAQNDTVVMTIFVNPTQFGEAADLAAYPRTEKADLALAAQAGVDVVFAPSVAEIYPAGFATTVSVAGPITETLEGAVRGRSHFDGVATVVSKLLLAALPDAAYFGAKDAQQVVVIRRMVADLGIPVRIEVCPTARDADGLALSSRNARLSAAERERAVAVPRALDAVTRAVDAGEREPSRAAAAGLAVLAAAGLEAEYLALVHPDTLEPVVAVAPPMLAALAVRVGETRLIDNVLLDAASSPLADSGGSE
ncbi:pantoate--beta-alanine ligase [Microbacterium hominis]|uniref:Pantothenate synthetase n=1 Tax=Microbacterium hominis TaxID=162426 RepID=A0A7D4UAE6_9MICO|nr:pantoate--beta-alanine ligase [Microbacterium hominis]QKJ18383.1 pantoate--beta-alanine ligase [Microbacterium hominis]